MTLTEAMHALLRELEVCIKGYIRIEFPNEELLRELTVLKLIDTKPTGLRGHLAALTDRGRGLLEALPDEVTHCPIRAWWRVEVQELGSFEFFGTRAEAETYGLEKRWGLGGGMLSLRLARRNEVIASRLRLERREASGQVLNVREREALRSMFFSFEAAEG